MESTNTTTNALTNGLASAPPSTSVGSGASPDTSAPAPVASSPSTNVQDMAVVTGPSAAPSLPQQPTAQPTQKPTSVWRDILTGALAGLAGAAGQKHFGGGLSAGAAGE